MDFDGRRSGEEERKKIFKDYQINRQLLAAANAGAMVQHCLPAYRGQEITEEVFEEHADEIFNEAENRLHAQKALLTWLAGKARGDESCWLMTDQTPALQRPATRAARLSAIEQALLTRIVTSQSQLSQILADQGIEVTQATLSRDLDEIHATKTRLADGTVAYALGKQPEEAALANPDAKTEQQMNRVLSGLVTSVAAARNLVVSIRRLARPSMWQV